MASITINMRGIHGDLYYQADEFNYRIPVEHTGDYKKGLLVFFNMISPVVADEEKPVILQRIRRDLQVWSKNQNQPLCW